jgi:hypothetical protein
MNFSFIYSPDLKGNDSLYPPEYWLMNESTTIISVVVISSRSFMISGTGNHYEDGVCLTERRVMMTKGRDKHVMEALGLTRVVIENGNVVEVGEPRIEYCPLFYKYRDIREITSEYR